MPLQMARMRELYEQMAQDFLEKGLDTNAIVDLQPSFHGVNSGG
jgi:hypothetical protein